MVRQTEQAELTRQKVAQGVADTFWPAFLAVVQNAGDFALLQTARAYPGGAQMRICRTGHSVIMAGHDCGDVMPLAEMPDPGSDQGIQLMGVHHIRVKGTEHFLKSTQSCTRIKTM